MIITKDVKMVVFKNKKFKVESAWISTDYSGGGVTEFFVDLHNGSNMRVFSSRDEAVKWACENEL